MQAESGRGLVPAAGSQRGSSTSHGPDLSAAPAGALETRIQPDADVTTGSATAAAWAQKANRKAARNPIRSASCPANTGPNTAATPNTTQSEAPASRP